MSPQRAHPRLFAGLNCKRRDMGETKQNIRWGLVIDLDRCTGCGVCLAVCQAENNIAPAPPGQDEKRRITWVRPLELDNGRAFPDNEGVFWPLLCQQCENPPCVPVCPVTATEKQSLGGIVSQVHARCIGCRYCMIACPYHARYFNWQDPSWPPGAEKALNPFVSVRPRGVVEKCSFCAHRWQLAKEKAFGEKRDPRALNEDEYIPACVEACPAKAFYFGDLNNPAHLVHKLAKSREAFRLLESSKTGPQVYYLSRRKWVRDLRDRLAGALDGKKRS